VAGRVQGPKKQHEADARRDRERSSKPVYPCHCVSERCGRQLDDDDRERHGWKRASSPDDERERECGDYADRDEHPGRQRHDESPELTADAVPVGAAQDRLRELRTDEGNDAGGRGDGDEADPRGRLDVSGRPGGIETGPRERHRSDEGERR
jgi:hypothetical protein